MIHKKQLSSMLQESVFIWLQNCDELSAIDSRFGDGDHGIAIKKIALLLEKEIPLLGEKSMYDFFDDLGRGIMGICGGSAGPLYGTMIGGMGHPLDGKTEINATTLKQMFASSLNEMQDITNAKVGDKTMMDSLIPAVEAALEADDDISAILKAMSEAALKGADDSRAYVSKFGRAKSYKEATIGTPDAGAVSTSLFLQGLYVGYKEESGH